MSLKLKKIFLVQFCFLNFVISFYAFASDPKPSKTITAPTSSFAASSGAGASAPGDASMMDANPAILPALKKQYSVFGGTSWQNDFDLIEAGIFDSTTTPVSMVIRGRETIPSDKISRDRSLKIGLGYQIPAIPNLSVGGSFEYQQLSLFKIWDWKSENYLMGAGLFYQLNVIDNNPIFLGLSTKGLFDKYNDNIVDIGASIVTLNNLVTLNSDALFDSNNGFQSIVSGANIAKTFLELKGSLGYNPTKARIFWGSGIFFKAPVLHIYYTLVKADSDDTTIRQTAGVELAFSL